ncbi:MAG: hypothetical protein QXP35_02280 [Candidatus Micrarchaeaceae archaeon]
MNNFAKKLNLKTVASRCIWNGTIRLCSLPADHFKKLDRTYISLNAFNEPRFTK